MKKLIVLGMLCATACSGKPEGRFVTRAEFESSGRTWPLGVTEGHIGCTGNERWFEHEGTRYALNGFANGNKKAYRPIEPLWLIDSKLMAAINASLKPGEIDSGSPIRINLSDLIMAAGEECDG
jgi:hypothetical protein